eukprot:9482848-Pyramimonas_sp.AAC.1
MGSAPRTGSADWKQFPNIILNWATLDSKASCFLTARDNLARLDLNPGAGSSRGLGVWRGAWGGPRGSEWGETNQTSRI